MLQSFNKLKSDNLKVVDRLHASIVQQTEVCWTLFASLNFMPLPFQGLGFGLQSVLGLRPRLLNVALSGLSLTVQTPSRNAAKSPPFGLTNLTSCRRLFVNQGRDEAIRLIK
jgi:hypothetical protein